MITLSFAAFLMLSVAIALVDWRRGWIMAVLCGVLQDPARKLTPGTPVIMTMSIVIVYFVIIFASQATIQRNARDLTRRYPNLYIAGMVMFLFLILAALNGLVTYGVEFWKVPALSLFIYLAPMPAVIIGYGFADREETIVKFFKFYSAITTLALVGTPLEYLKIKWAALGMVGLPEGFIRYMPGLQIRILSGFYRAPDIMGWHASMLAVIGLTMAIRGGSIIKSWPWLLTTGWGFLNCIISGRRKAVYMVVAYAVFFIWRYARRLTVPQIVSVALCGVVLIGVVHKLGESEESSVYTKGTVTTKEEIFERLEGGLGDTINQFGIMGAGLGTATQGVRHILGHDDNVGWQEGGLGKLAIEVGVPGLIAAVIFGIVLFTLILKMTKFPDEPSSSQLIRVALFGIFLANVVEFMVSAQAYSDPVLTLVTAFLLGCLLATPALSERAEAAKAIQEANVIRRPGTLPSGLPA